MKFQFFILLSALVLFGLDAHAAVEPDYNPSKPPVTTPWFGNVGAGERAADLNFIKGMRPHHAGALTMSNDYLKNPNASDARLKKLARGIIHNQNFEIGMLDVVEGFAKPDAPTEGKQWRQIATQGLAQKQKFVRAPLPPLWGRTNVSTEDVRFAKAMIVHHEGAVEMCRDYLDDTNARNKYLRLLCVDIQKDQTLDINFMNSVIADYPGNPADVKVDPSMVHGMEGMSHGHGASHGGHVVQDKKAPVKKMQPVKPSAKKEGKVSGHHNHHQGH